MAMSIRAVADSITVRANPHVAHMLGAGGGLYPAACNSSRDFVKLKLYGARAVLYPSVTAVLVE